MCVCMTSLNAGSAGVAGFAGVVLLLNAGGAGVGGARVGEEDEGKGEERERAHEQLYVAVLGVRARTRETNAPGHERAVRERHERSVRVYRSNSAHGYDLLHGPRNLLHDAGGAGVERGAFALHG